LKFKEVKNRLFFYHIIIKEEIFNKKREISKVLTSALKNEKQRERKMHSEYVSGQNGGNREIKGNKQEIEK